jgi:hypothetical protein
MGLKGVRQQPSWHWMLLLFILASWTGVQTLPMSDVFAKIERSSTSP